MEWKPIESAPRDGTRVLIFVPGDLTWVDCTGKTNASTYPGVHAARYEEWITHDVPDVPVKKGAWLAGGDLWSDEELKFEHVQPTHWMPLPAPPIDANA